MVKAVGVTLVLALSPAAVVAAGEPFTVQPMVDWATGSVHLIVESRHSAGPLAQRDEQSLAPGGATLKSLAITLWGLGRQIVEALATIHAAGVTIQASRALLQHRLAAPGADGAPRMASTTRHAQPTPEETDGAPFSEPTEVKFPDPALLGRRPPLAARLVGFGAAALALPLALLARRRSRRSAPARGLRRCRSSSFRQPEVEYVLLDGGSPDSQDEPPPHTEYFPMNSECLGSFWRSYRTEVPEGDSEDIGQAFDEKMCLEACPWAGDAQDLAETNDVVGLLPLGLMSPTGSRDCSFGMEDASPVAAIQRRTFRMDTAGQELLRDAASSVMQVDMFPESRTPSRKSLKHMPSSSTVFSSSSLSEFAPQGSTPPTPLSSAKRLRASKSADSSRFAVWGQRGTADFHDDDETGFERIIPDSDSEVEEDPIGKAGAQQISANHARSKSDTTDSRSTVDFQGELACGSGDSSVEVSGGLPASALVHVHKLLSELIEQEARAPSGDAGEHHISGAAAQPEGADEEAAAAARDTAGEPCASSGRPATPAAAAAREVSHHGCMHQRGFEGFVYQMKMGIELKMPSTPQQTPKPTPRMPQQTTRPTSRVFAAR